MARASLFTPLVAGIVACGTFLAAEQDDRPGGADADAPDTGLADGVAPDGLPAPDAAVDRTDGGPDGKLRGCAVTKAFGAPVPLTLPFGDDIRSIRRRGSEVYFAHVPGGGSVAADLGAAPILQDAGFGTPHVDWFAAVNGTGGQTIPAPSGDGLRVVFQEEGNTQLRVTSRTGSMTAFGPATDLVLLASPAIEGEPLEPYITSANDLYFATSAGFVYQATLTTTGATVARRMAELSEARLPVVSDDGLEIFFVRVANGVQKVFHATRADKIAPFDLPALDVVLSTDDANTRPTWISPDGCNASFVRTTGKANTGPFGVFVATRL